MLEPKGHSAERQHAAVRLVVPFLGSLLFTHEVKYYKSQNKMVLSNGKKSTKIGLNYFEPGYGIH